MISLQLLTKKKQNTRRVYPDSQPPIKPPTQPHSSQEVTISFNLTCKNMQSKKKQIKYFQLLQEKSNFVSSRKQPHVSSDYNL